MALDVDSVAPRHTMVYVWETLSTQHFWVQEITTRLYSLYYGLKGTYYENNTFLGIWGVVLGLWCSHTHTNFEKSLYMIFFD